jgi:hypothetical protein
MGMEDENWAYNQTMRMVTIQWCSDHSHWFTYSYDPCLPIPTSATIFPCLAHLPRQPQIPHS